MKLQMVHLQAVNPLVIQHLQKTRSIRQIYEKEHEFDQHNTFAFLLSQPTHFEEEVKENHWIDAMIQEFATIEKNRTWELANLPR